MAIEAAESLVAEYPADLIAQQIESFDFLMAQKDRKISKNPAGYLVSAIRAEYSKPAGFVSDEDRRQKEQEAELRKAKREQKKREAEEREKVKEAAKRNAITEFWADLPGDIRASYEKQAFAEADAIARRYLEREDQMGREIRQGLLDRFALKMMAAG